MEGQLNLFTKKCKCGKPVGLENPLLVEYCSLHCQWLEAKEVFGL